DGGDAAEDDAPTRATTVFRTFDGLEVTVESSGTDGATWIRLSAAALPPAADEQDGTGPGDEPAGDAGADGADSSGGEAAAGDAAAADGAGADDAEAGATAVAGEEKAGEADDAADAPDPEAEAREINARVSGWEY